jgi:hypothetical protein
MVPAVFESEIKYVQSHTTLVAQLAAIEAVRAALLTQMANIAAIGSVSEYFFNDGQTTIKKVYTNIGQIQTTRQILETEANEIRVQLRGGCMVRLVPNTNFIGRR